MATNTPKTSRLEARLPESVRVLLARAAALQGRSLSDFVVSSAREAAERAIAEHNVLNISLADQELFAECLLSPKPIGKPLKQAARRHKQQVEPS